MTDEYGEGEVCESRRNDNYYLYITSHLIMVLLLISVVSLLVSIFLFDKWLKMMDNDTDSNDNDNNDDG